MEKSGHGDNETELGAIVHIGVNQLRGLIEESIGYTNHSRLVKVHHDALMEDMRSPAENNLYIVW